MIKSVRLLSDNELDLQCKRFNIETESLRRADKIRALTSKGHSKVYVTGPQKQLKENQRSAPSQTLLKSDLSFVQPTSTNKLCTNVADKPVLTNNVVVTDAVFSNLAVQNDLYINGNLYSHGQLVNPEPVCYEIYENAQDIHIHSDSYTFKIKNSGLGTFNVSITDDDLAKSYIGHKGTMVFINETSSVVTVTFSNQFVTSLTGHTLSEMGRFSFNFLVSEDLSTATDNRIVVLEFIESTVESRTDITNNINLYELSNFRDLDPKQPPNDGNYLLTSKMQNGNGTPLLAWQNVTYYIIDVINDDSFTDDGLGSKLITFQNNRSNYEIITNKDITLGDFGDSNTSAIGNNGFIKVKNTNSNGSITINNTYTDKNNNDTIIITWQIKDPVISISPNEYIVFEYTVVKPDLVVCKYMYIPSSTTRDYSNKENLIHVTVNKSDNKYEFKNPDGNALEKLDRGTTYTFLYQDNSFNQHPLRFSDVENGFHSFVTDEPNDVTGIMIGDAFNINERFVNLNTSLSTNESPTNNAGIVINRGKEPSSFLYWDESHNYWSVSTATFQTNNLIVGFASNGNYIQIDDNCILHIKNAQDIEAETPYDLKNLYNVVHQSDDFTGTWQMYSPANFVKVDTSTKTVNTGIFTFDNGDFAQYTSYEDINTRLQTVWQTSKISIENHTDLTVDVPLVLNYNKLTLNINNSSGLGVENNQLTLNTGNNLMQSDNAIDIAQNIEIDTAILDNLWVKIAKLSVQPTNVVMSGNGYKIVTFEDSAFNVYTYSDNILEADDMTDTYTSSDDITKVLITFNGNRIFVLNTEANITIFNYINNSWTKVTTTISINSPSDELFVNINEDGSEVYVYNNYTLSTYSETDWQGISGSNTIDDNASQVYINSSGQALYVKSDSIYIYEPTFQITHSNVSNLKLSDDGTIVVFTHNDSTKIYKNTENTEFITIDETFDDYKLSYNGEYLVTRKDNLVKVYNNGIVIFTKEYTHSVVFDINNTGSVVFIDDTLYQYGSGGGSNSSSSPGINSNGQIINSYKPTDGVQYADYGIVCTDSKMLSKGFTTHSDERLKENVVTIKEATQKLQKLTGVYFNYINNKDTTCGLIAQQVETVMPEIVSTDNVGYKGVEYDKLTSLLINGFNELVERIDNIESRINSLGC